MKVSHSMSCTKSKKKKMINPLPNNNYGVQSTFHTPYKRTIDHISPPHHPKKNGKEKETN